jgi:ATP-dependent RNA helicase DeaD
VAGRGLDFSHVTHVINYDFPFNPEIYTHRTGRAGRMGREGTAITFVSDRELGDLKRLLKAYQIEAHWCGEEPDLDKVRAKRSGGGGGRNGSRGGGGRGRGSSRRDNDPKAAAKS